MTRHQGSTDQAAKIKLSSSLRSVQWTRRMASPGGHVGLEVFAEYVGNGAEVEIEYTDQTGKTLGKCKGRVFGSRFWLNIQVPAGAKQALYADVKLPKHGLQMKSGPLILLPPVEIRNPKWDKKEARRGDLLKLTADVKGAPDGTEGEIEIWEYDSDGAHDFISKIPVLVKNNKIEAEWEYEYHEDTDEIPTKEEAEKGYNPPEYFFRAKVGEISSDSGLLEFKDKIKISLLDEAGHPLANEEYKVILADGNERKGRLDSDGTIEIKDIPPGKVFFEFPNISLAQTSKIDY